MAVVGNGNRIEGNLIGTDITGMNAIPNGVGIDLDRFFCSHESEVINNLISGNGYGITGCVAIGRVEGNFIGTDITGKIRLGNGIGIMVWEDAGSFTILNNLISGNAGDGVVIGGLFGISNAMVFGNFIGTDIDAEMDLGNGGDGIQIRRAPPTATMSYSVSNNIIAFNMGDGVRVEALDPFRALISRNSIFSHAGLGGDVL